jgi:type VI secretion system protein ImpC
VRLSGLGSIAAAGAASKAGARAGIEMSVKSKLADAEERGSGKRAKPSDDDDTPSADVDTDSSDTDDLLASLGSSDSDDTLSADAGDSDDLDALLASLGGDDDSSDTPAADEEPPADDGDMDAELAALLKSLG